MKNEWKDECEWMLFSFGKHVLGEKSGGVINKLMRARGIRSAWNVIMASATKENPIEYIGAAMREATSVTTEISDEKYQELLAKYQAKVARYG